VHCSWKDNPSDAKEACHVGDGEVVCTCMMCCVAASEQGRATTHSTSSLPSAGRVSRSLSPCSSSSSLIALSIASPESRIASSQGLPSANLPSSSKPASRILASRSPTASFLLLHTVLTVPIFVKTRNSVVNPISRSNGEHKIRIVGSTAEWQFLRRPCGLSLQISSGCTERHCRRSRRRKACH